MRCVCRQSLQCAARCLSFSAHFGSGGEDDGAAETLILSSPPCDRHACSGEHRVLRTRRARRVRGDSQEPEVRIADDSVIVVTRNSRVSDGPCEVSNPIRILPVRSRLQRRRTDEGEVGLGKRRWESSSNRSDRGYKAVACRIDDIVRSFTLIDRLDL